jgi:hypothetical protein
MVMQDDSNSFDPLIDPLIGDVAREMTGARPVDDIEGFVRRVSARIQSADADAAGAPRTWVRGWVLAPAAAVVLVLAGPSAPTKTASGLTATASGQEAKGLGLGEVQPSAGFARPRVVRAEQAPPGLSGDPDFQPLTTVPIEMASLDVSPLVVAMPIEISAIAIERIEIGAMP